MVDIHSHIIPNIDNGAFSESVSLQILSYFETLDVKKIIATPKISADYPNNTPSFIRKEFNALKDIYIGKIELSLGAEYTLDCDFIKHLKSGDLLTLFDNYLLVVMQKDERLDDVIDLMSGIIEAGYIVVLAHPENYQYLGCVEYAKLKKMGVLFQLNMLSIAGSYGDNRKRRAEYLLKHSLYDFVGSNVHSYINSSKAIRTSRVSSNSFKRIESLKSNKLLNI